MDLLDLPLRDRRRCPDDGDRDWGLQGDRPLLHGQVDRRLEQLPVDLRAAVSVSWAK